MLVVGAIFAITGGLEFFLMGMISYLISITGTIPDSLPNNDIYFNTKVFNFLVGLVSFIATVVFVPFYEELMYRGIVLRAYEKARSPLFAAFFTTVLFSLYHTNWINLLLFVPSSFILARAVQVYGSWWIAVIAHASHNGLVFFINSKFFPLVDTFVIKNTISLTTGLSGLAIAILTFFGLLYWFKIRTEDLLHNNKNTERLFTPALNIFIIVCFYVMIRQII